MRKRLVLLQALAILMAVFQYGVRDAGQEEGRYSPRSLSTIFYPYLLIARYAQNQVELYALLPSAQLHGKVTPLMQFIIKYSRQSCANLRTYSVPIICIHLSRIPSGIDEWLAATGHTVNHAHIRGHRKPFKRRHDRVPLRKLPQIFIGIIITYGTRKVSLSVFHTMPQIECTSCL